MPVMFCLVTTSRRASADERHGRVFLGQRGEDGPLLRRDFRLLEDGRETAVEKVRELNDAGDQVAFARHVWSIY